MSGKGDNQFNIFTWARSIPLCDDLWLGMQAQNIALVDLAIIRDIESSALEAYLERERTPTDILMPLSALSQMWVFSLYEFLRTWRQRAGALMKIADAHLVLADSDRPQFLLDELEKVKKKEKHIRNGISFHGRHVSKIADPAFVESVKKYQSASDGLFRLAEMLRVTLAKHEVPKTPGLLAEAPGYGRMSYRDGSMYWSVILKDDSQVIVNRRELSNTFLGIEDDPI